MNTVVHEQDNKRPELVQPPERIDELPRYERWGRAAAEIEALPQELALYEYKAQRAAIWARWGL